MHQFKTVPGWDKYKVSQNGLLIRSETNLTRLIKGYKHQSRSNTYTRVKLSQNGIVKRMFLHEIVALVFFGPKMGQVEVDHIDGDTMNNSVSNLEYVSPDENKRRYQNRAKVLKNCADK